MLIIISGPSQVGKNAVIAKLLEKSQELNLTRATTYTTRERRPEEKEGIDHHFVSEEEFKKLIRDNFFVEWAPVRERYFGTSKQDLIDLLAQGKNIVLEIDVRGTTQIKQYFPKALTIFILPDSLKNLKERMEKKGFSPEQMKIRWQEAMNEIEESKNYDYRVINEKDKLEQTVMKVIDIIKKNS